MNKEWTALKTGKEVFDRAADGWEIEVLAGNNAWYPWSETLWFAGATYHGRPKQPQTKKMKLEAWLDSRPELRFLVAGYEPSSHNWVRVQSEDKEIEVEV